MNILYTQTITKDYVDGRVDQVQNQFQDRFGKIELKLAEHDTRFDFVDEKIDNLKEVIEFSYNSLRGGLNDLSEEMDARFMMVEERFDGVETRLSAVESELKTVGKQITALDEKFTPLLGLLTLIQK